MDFDPDAMLQNLVVGLLGRAVSDCGGDPNCGICTSEPVRDDATACGPACYDSEAKEREARRYEPRRKDRVRKPAHNAARHRKVRRSMQKASRRANR